MIEDAAQAHGAVSNGKHPGAHRVAAAFSFYPTKNLGGYGDCGAVISNDLELCGRVKRLREGGHPAALQTGEIGRNSRLDEIQAAVLRTKLKYLEEWNLRRVALAKMYFEHLSHLGRRLTFPDASGPGTHAYHLFVAQHENRDALRTHMAAQGIEP